MQCAKCNEKSCAKGKNCYKEISEKAMKEYENDENLKIAKTSSYIEGTYYMKKTRLEEIIEFCKLMEYKKIGIAFCIGVENEAKTLDKILSKYFKTYSVCCKVCGISKDDLGLTKINPNNRESMCNPIAQAMILNEKNTDLNIMIGLCIGHDMLFQKYSRAPTTTFLVKDRVLAHNPAGVLYSKYYVKKKFHIE
ncbi:DUF1847 domain-containing protein [Methanothermococcus okinawensis]|uniref:Metal-binding protein n=1 Tax=Methanothermococcus okinawensis (strain DSM 14208 / JCM 11175 / IH1) TaxID=647113 RepID=F8AN08_METOI|nr:DUF1847 domain-containing protein [Methanothermococcus okinawensis]AEH06134.1 protein of unknown function DUF1847 [Methanothermococcus okinawensis IH1]